MKKTTLLFATSIFNFIYALSIIVLLFWVYGERESLFHGMTHDFFVLIQSGFLVLSLLIIGPYAMRMLDSHVRKYSNLIALFAVINLLITTFLFEIISVVGYFLAGNLLLLVLLGSIFSQEGFKRALNEIKTSKFDNYTDFIREMNVEIFEEVASKRLRSMQRLLHIIAFMSVGMVNTGILIGVIVGQITATIILQKQYKLMIKDHSNLVKKLTWYSVFEMGAILLAIIFIIIGNYNLVLVCILCSDFKFEMIKEDIFHLRYLKFMGLELNSQ